MEPTFTESASETVTAELAAQLAQARAALPPSHCLNPQAGELTESREAARKLKEEERKRVQTNTQSNGCKFSLVVSYSKEQGSWIIRSKCLEHNHAPNPDPFSYHQHKDKVPGYRAALAAASIHRGVVGYKEHTALLKKDDLPRISKKQFYNLQRKEEVGTMTRQQELEYIVQLLEAEDIHVRYRAEHMLDDGESAASFKFVSDQLSDLAFNDCPEAAVIVGDFSKGLGAACAAKAAADLGLTEIIDEPLVCPHERDGELPEAAAVIVGESQGYPQQVILQLCEWHAVSAIKKRLV
ncbi:hypothetical protein V8E54_012817 [Elaphomyces granulatus]